MPVITLDLDDVLVSYCQAYLDFAATRGANALRVTELVDLHWAGPLGITTEAELELDREFAQDPSYRTCPAVEGAAEAVRALQATFDVHVVTARGVEKRAATESWMRDILGVDVPLHLLGLYGTTPGAARRQKSEVCLELGSQVHVDDNLSYAREICEAGIPVVVFGEYPWNRAPLPPGAVAAPTWSEALAHIQNLCA